MKYCPKCDKNKENNEFNIKRASVDGLHNKCKSCMKLQNKNHYINNRDKKIQYAQLYQKQDNIKQYQNEYSKINHSTYYNKNKKRILEYGKRYTNHRYHTDYSFKLGLLLRTRFYHALKRGFKIHSVIDLLGSTIEECRLYVESQFKPEMTWDNHGVIWEIDHIIPCSSFDLTDIEQQKQCFHYSNTQPLFKTTSIAESFGYKNEIGNRNKSDNYEE
jgi:hypothetical protein